MVKKNRDARKIRISARDYLEEFHKLQGGKRYVNGFDVLQEKWQKPPFVTLKLNEYASVVKDGNHIGVGTVVRD